MYKFKALDKLQKCVKVLQNLRLENFKKFYFQLIFIIFFLNFYIIQTFSTFT